MSSTLKDIGEAFVNLLARKRASALIIVDFIIKPNMVEAIRRLNGCDETEANNIFAEVVAGVYLKAQIISITQYHLCLAAGIARCIGKDIKEILDIHNEIYTSVREYGKHILEGGVIDIKELEKRNIKWNVFVKQIMFDEFVLISEKILLEYSKYKSDNIIEEAIFFTCEVYDDFLTTNELRVIKKLKKTESIKRSFYNAVKRNHIPSLKRYWNNI